MIGADSISGADSVAVSRIALKDVPHSLQKFALDATRV